MLKPDSIESTKTAAAALAISLDSTIGMKYYEDCLDYYKEALEIFERRVQSLISELHAAQSENNYNSIKVLMHSLCSIAGYVGAIPLQTIAKKIELAAINMQGDELHFLIEELLAEINQVQLAVNKFLQN